MGIDLEFAGGGSTVRVEDARRNMRAGLVLQRVIEALPGGDKAAVRQRRDHRVLLEGERELAQDELASKRRPVGVKDLSTDRIGAGVGRRTTGVLPDDDVGAVRQCRYLRHLLCVRRGRVDESLVTIGNWC